MRTGIALWIVTLTLIAPSSVVAQNPAARPAWDQKKAAEKVKAVLDTENSKGQPWDKIQWLTDVPEAVARSQKEQKPIFVYFFLKKNVGPADAPC